MNNFFEEFKPIRNIFRRLNLWDVLYELRNMKRKKHIPEILEFIYLNALVYSPEYKIIKTKNPRLEWQKLIIYSNRLHEKVNAHWIENDVWGFLHKLFLNQSKATPNHLFNHLYRYFYIFSDVKLVGHIERMLDMPYRDFFTCAMWIHSVFDKKSYVIEKTYFYQEKNENTALSPENMNKTLNILSIGLQELKEHLKYQLKYDSNLFITHNYEHVKKPIFELNQKLYCLFPDLLLNQYTNGVYYLAELYDGKYKLNNAFGACFEQYVGVVLDKNRTSKIKITKELKFNRGQNKTSDWIIESGNSIVLLECKTKRLQIQSKKYEDILESDISSIIHAVFQTYKVYNCYKNDEIEELKFAPEKFFIPVIVTLEEWYAGIPDLNNEIRNKVKIKLKSVGINENLVDKFKFHITSISSFEVDIQMMTKFGFKEYYEGIQSGKLNKDEFEYVSYFGKEIEKEILKPLGEQFQ